MKFIENWRSVWRWYSVWFAGVIASMPVAWGLLPPDLKASLPDEWMPWISVAIFVAFLVARVIKQEGRA